MEIQLIHLKFLQSAGVVIDTRKIVNNSFFVAIKGEKFDANTFAAEALKKGCSYVIIDNPAYYIDERTIIVNDSIQMLQQLATYHRSYLNIPILALTGSNGKTTSKELINCVLQKKYQTSATVGNLNNHIGVPLTLLSFTKSTQLGILEMGANHQKEIELLCNIVLPDYGHITNFGKAHLEGFGGFEGVIKGKSEMYVHLRDNHKIVFVNANEVLQVENSKDIETVLFGVNITNSFVNIKHVTANPFVTVHFNEVEIKSKLIGLYNANNINVAIAIGKYFGVTDLDIKNAIESYVPDNNRSQIIFKNSNQIILDAYNANPSSMRVAIDNFIQLEKANKVIFLGDMYEVGADSEAEHLAIVQLLTNQTDIKCYFIGNEFLKVQTLQPHFTFNASFDDLKLHQQSFLFSDSTILIKGSRGMALERILELL